MTAVRFAVATAAVFAAAAGARPAVISTDPGAVYIQISGG